MPASHANHGQMTSHHYGRLPLMTVLSFAAMYGLMYAMVDSLNSVYNSLNQVYMGHVSKPNAERCDHCSEPDRARRLLIRTQSAIDDRQFLRSMCEQVAIQDKEIQCKTIIAGQADEIRQMKAKLEALAQ